MTINERFSERHGYGPDHEPISVRPRTLFVHRSIKYNIGGRRDVVIGVLVGAAEFCGAVRIGVLKVSRGLAEVEAPVGHQYCRLINGRRDL